ncbi:hypothetical protein BGZ52_006608 [Haplosporangium bisporale]|nr:hypothetical protein BGZ52_006608 [Haplosporangium bisporale]
MTPPTSEAPALDSNAKKKQPTVFEDLDSKDNRISVATKATSEIMIALLVYKLCTWTWLVKLAPSMISVAETVHLSLPVYWVIRKTFFAQFCGGETAKDCVNTMESLKVSGVNSILDLSVEADLEATSSTKTHSDEQTRQRLNKHADSVAEQIRTCIKTASHQPQAFAAVKITALGSPLVLQQVTTTLSALEGAFESLDTNNTGRLDKEGFTALFRMLSNPKIESLDQLFQDADCDKDGFVDWVDVKSSLSFNTKARELFLDASPTRIPGLAKEDLDDYEVMLHRLETLCDQALSTHTRLMIDAEQTYFQLAINTVVLHLQQKYNVKAPEGPLIFNTYQMYLKAAPKRLRDDYRHSQRNEYVLAAKLVRGAYINSERQRAKDLGLADPICDGIEATHQAYDAGVHFLLHEIGSSTLSTTSAVVVVASHNKGSVVKVIRQMQELGISPESGVVLFGQLLGMCDQMSYTLGRHGYGIYKYVPYGPIQQVIPYLLRRAQENSALLGGAGAERALLWEELKIRLLGSHKNTIQNSSAST